MVRCLSPRTSFAGGPRTASGFGHVHSGRTRHANGRSRAAVRTADCGAGSGSAGIHGPERMQNRIFKHARILIVDDERANVELLQRLLERAGFDKVESHDRTPPRRRSCTSSHRPDLILLDLHMPGMDGLAVMDQLNEIAEASYLPILMLTGDMTPDGAPGGAVARRQGFREQAVSRRRSAAPDPHAARDPLPLFPGPEPEPDPRSQGARAHPRARGRADRDHRTAGAGRGVPRRQHRAAHRTGRPDGGAAGAAARAARSAGLADPPRRAAARRRQDRHPGLDPAEARAS